MSTIACQLHKSHSPAPLTVEQHHVVPRGWQHTWQPSTPPFPGKDPEQPGAVLWDARTIPVPPTCHRNVHVWIVRLMHALEGGEDPVQAFAKVKGAAGGTQAKWALEALVRFKEAGGSLQTLVAAREWGES